MKKFSFSNIANFIKLCLITAFVLVFTNVTLAWLASELSIGHADITATIIAHYFESGDGTEEHPYVISNPQHLYNFSWLYNINNDLLNHFKGAGVHYFLKNDIDVAGFYDKGTGATGALPPIGSSEHPFRGYFDGNGKTISNLWISSDPNDWKESPDGLTDADRNDISAEFTTGIGFFGDIRKGEGESVYAGNFFLEAIEVTSNVSCESIGIVAGYAEADLRNIGVKGATISFNESNKTVGSHYTLIGYTPNEDNWNDIPETSSSGGGDLIIAPNGYKDTEKNFIYQPMATQTSGMTPVSGSAEDSAYYCGNLRLSTPSPNPDSGATGKFYKYKSVVSFNNVSFNNDGKANITVSTNSQVDDLMRNVSSQAGVDDFFINYISSKNYFSNATEGVQMLDDYRGIDPQGSATFSGTTPNNCVWFKPRADGIAYISFIRQNNSGDNTMSLFRFKRNANNTIDQNSVQEISFTNGKNAKLGNGATILFEIQITEEEILAGYEYAIGRPTSASGYAALFFLKLAGSNIHGSGTIPEAGEGKILNRIEFVPQETGSTFFTNSEYEVSKTVLSFSGSTGSNASSIILKFNEINESGTNVTYYYTNTSPIEVVENVRSAPESQGTTDTSKFIDREESS